jgi:hypothetical protein
MVNAKSAFLSTLLKNSQGRFVGVTFIKKDGSTRVLNGRMGVKKYVKNDGTNTNRSILDVAGTPYITIYDVQNKGYRNIHPDHILSIRVDGVSAKIQTKEVK